MEEDASAVSLDAAPDAGLGAGQKKSKTPIIVAIVAIIAVVVVAAFFVVQERGKAELRELLLQDWSRVEGEGGSYYRLKLDFSEDEIDYIFDATLVRDTIATYYYEVTSPSEIEVRRFAGQKEGEKISITFDDDKSMMTMRPAITSSDSYEFWFDH